ncbi:MAG: hypothetical protein OXB92_00985, partial [Acidimicrobiaceae bacterium]|nr:hypothetical protein [Acidimicrobiaceae bacterium]
SCRDLAVFKAFFDRGKDWQDINEMVKAGSVGVRDLADELAGLLGKGDHRVAQVQKLRDGPEQ